MNRFPSEQISLWRWTGRVVYGNASATIVPFQAAAPKHGLSLFSDSGSASTGTTSRKPLALGSARWPHAAVSCGISCLAGDGSIMMILQELQKIAQHCVPIKIFVLNSRGCLAIQCPDKSFFGDWHLTTSCRPEPVYLDIPIDVQSAWIELATLRRIVPHSSPHPMAASTSTTCCHDWRPRVAPRPSPVPDYDPPPLCASKIHQVLDLLSDSSW